MNISAVRNSSFNRSVQSASDFTMHDIQTKKYFSFIVLISFRAKPLLTSLDQNKYDFYHEHGGIQTLMVIGGLNLIYLYLKIF
jgi:hypothetical protein